ncbi:MAG: hypothetical protein J5994_09210 [Ruminococcus sp.]|nr:hypothetical protein [Ruminococcus sp.]
MKFLKKIAASICAAVCASTAVSALPVSAAEVLKYEAENASLSGVSAYSGSGFSGGGYVRFTSSGSCTFNIYVPKSGIYSFNFVSEGIGSDKVNNASLDGESIGSFTSKADSLDNAEIYSVYVSEGDHQVTVTPSWGWIDLDCLIVQEEVVKDFYNVSKDPVNPNASESAKRLMSYLADNYGKNVISGQSCDNGYYGNEFTAIRNQTGKTPAILGMDLMDYTPARANRGISCQTVENAIEFSKKGGIVELYWHWNAPDQYLRSGYDDNGNPRWWGGFYTSNLNIDFSKIMDGTDSEGHAQLLADINAIAAQLKRLKDADVPVLFRPLHEASGGWFWWGSDGKDAYLQLWEILYNKLTYEYELDNLIWVWNGQNKDWYPGDEYVDIIGEDIYPGERVYSPQTSKFSEAAKYTEASKIVALSENGCLFDVDKALDSGMLWSWFCVWNGEFCCNGSSISEKYSEKSMWNKVYNHENVITLDELPDLKNYPYHETNIDISGSDITLSQNTYTYTGGVCCPDVTVKYKDKILEFVRDYTVSYGTNTDAGSAYVNVWGKGDYTGSKKQYFTIAPRKLSDCDITLSSDTRYFTGTRAKPVVTVKIDGRVIDPSNYTTSYSNNLSVGTGTVKITGRKNLTGTVTKSFSVVQRSIGNCDVRLSADSVYFTGSRIKPEVSVYIGDTKLYSGNYTAVYSNNLSAGTATVKITGKNNLKGTVTKTFKINPRSVKNCDISLTANPKDPSKPNVTVKIGDNVIYSGNYSVSYGNTSNGKTSVTVKGKNNLKDSVTLNYSI